MKKLTVAAGTAFAAIGIVASVAAFRPRPTRLAVTMRAGDDTVVLNQARATRLAAMVLDQYGRRLAADTTVRYRRIGGDTLDVSASGRVACGQRSDVVVRASIAALSKDFVLRCRPVASIEAASWIEMMVGDSARDLAFAAHGPDGRIVTELRGVVSIENSAIAEVTGTAIRPKHPGTTFASIEIGGVRTVIPLGVYEPVTSLVNQPPKQMMGVRVALGRGDTIVMPVPKAAFWVTYYPAQHGASPPTIELIGDGACSTGNGLGARRVEEDVYAKYCNTGDGVRMRIAHGTVGADTVRGLIAVRMMWR